MLFMVAQLGVFINACLPICNCPPVDFPFFQPTSIIAYADENLIAQSDSSAFISIQMDEYTFTAQKSCPNFVGVLYACSCISDGYEGDKYPIVDYDIRCIEDFDTMHPAGSSVKDLSMLGSYSYDYQNDTNTFQAFSFAGNDGLQLSYSEPVISINEKPDSLNTGISFMVYMINANNDTLTATTNPITWF